MWQKSWHWQHFFEGPKANTSQLKGYCNYFTQYQLRIIEENEKKALDDGTIEAMRCCSMSYCLIWRGRELKERPPGFPVMHEKPIVSI
jgi:hypothetical protein